MISTLVVLFNGLAYGMLLFIIAVGLSVTMGMMRFVNLAHITFSMVGGYVLVATFLGAGIPFLLCLPIAFIVVAVISAVIERTLFQWFYDTTDLVQVLLTIGIVFMSIAVMSFFFGPSYQPRAVPSWLTGRTVVGGIDFETYRLFLVIVGAVLAAALILGLERTRFGAMVRACVDNQRAANGSGLNPKLVFAITFAVGGGLAGLGGALSAGLLSLDPNFPLRYLVVVLIVVSLGGMGTITGTLLASVLIGIADVAGKYYFPEYGGFAIYIFTVVALMFRPHGLLGRTV